MEKPKGSLGERIRQTVEQVKEEEAENRRKLIASLKDQSTKDFAIREFAKLGLTQ